MSVWNHVDDCATRSRSSLSFEVPYFRQLVPHIFRPTHHGFLKSYESIPNYILHAHRRVHRYYDTTRKGHVADHELHEHLRDAGIRLMNDAHRVLWVKSIG